MAPNARKSLVVGVALCATGTCGFSPSCSFTGQMSHRSIYSQRLYGNTQDLPRIARRGGRVSVQPVMGLGWLRGRGRQSREPVSNTRVQYSCDSALHGAEWISWRNGEGKEIQSLADRPLRRRMQIRNPITMMHKKLETARLIMKGLAVFVLTMGMKASRSAAMHIAAPSGDLVIAPLEPRDLMYRLALWFFLFTVSAAFHAAEIAITTLYPWKVKEFAEQEGDKSPFRILNNDITRVLTTILVTTTICTIYSAALFTNTAIQVFGSKGIAYATAALTAITLFFGELLPKALGVSNAEMVARGLVPIINVMAVFLSPIGKGFSLISKMALKFLGFKSEGGDAVSEEELRLIVSGAKQSGGIETEEASMVEGVLDLQITKVTKVMSPRTEVVAIEKGATMADLCSLVKETMYSRIPVYEGAIDRIIGVVLSKGLLDFIPDPANLETITVFDRMEPTYFVPETMTVWNVLEGMQKRRLHMAIVVDEYGGTSGIITLEDIIEEITGEIYDEEDDDDYKMEEQFIVANGDGSFTINAMTPLEFVRDALDFPQVSEDDLTEFGTLSGYLCCQAGEIPTVGNVILAGRYQFTVSSADERRIEEVNARLIQADDAPLRADDATAAIRMEEVAGKEDAAREVARQEQEAEIQNAVIA